MLTDPGRDGLVAVGMNGEPLPLEHGFPVRMVTPGLYGYVSATKWLTEVELTTFDAFDAQYTNTTVVIPQVPGLTLRDVPGRGGGGRTSDLSEVTRYSAGQVRAVRHQIIAGVMSGADGHGAGTEAEAAGDVVLRIPDDDDVFATEAVSRVGFGAFYRDGGEGRAIRSIVTKSAEREISRQAGVE